ncbi:MAG: TIGR02147 family protein [Bacteriovoracaceae bacterium]
MNKTHKQFREVLKEEFLRRISKNSHYSMRSYAKDLAVNDSTLSQILAGKRKMTAERIMILGKRLKLSDADIEAYICSMQVSSSVTVDLKTFNLISEWYYDVVIELTKVKRFELTPSSIARILGIKKIKAEHIMAQLQELGIIEQDRRGNWHCHQEQSLTSFFEDSVSSSALRQYQEQILELSRDALISKPRDIRNHTSHIIAIDSSIVLEIHHKIRKFQEELTDFIETKSKNKNSIYALQFTSFPILTKENLT